MKKTSISFALARFVFISYLSLAVITSILVINYVLNSTNKEYDKIINREISTITNNYKIFIEQHLILLAEQANTPLYIQALMQPDANLGKVQDFMSDLTLLGKQYEESLLDFEGNTLHTTTKDINIDYQQFTWVNQLLQQQQNNHVSAVNISGAYYWSLAVPIYYNNQVEGVLVANIPIDFINQQSQNSRLNGLMVEIIQDEKVLTSFGNSITGRQHLEAWQQVGVVFRFTIDDTALNEELSRLAFQLGAIILIAIAITTFLTYLFGYRYFVKPILSLSKATDQLDKGDERINLTENIHIRELAELFKKFNLMTEKVAKREDALRKSYSKLSCANDELKQSESQLVQSEKMASIGVLASGVAHEINNPIGFIKSNLSMLRDYFVDIEKYYHTSLLNLTNETQRAIQQDLAKKHDIEFFLKDIPPLLESSIGGVERVTEIVQSLKTFARIDLPDKSIVDINEGLNATLNMVWNELKFNCKIHVDLKPLPRIFAYPGKLNQVFMNLLINAGQSIDDKGDIYVRTYVKNNDIVVEVKDTGCGINPEHLSQIFTPFYTTKAIGEGTGLGLSISHQIIEQHDGRLDVVSTLGEGSCFSLYLPIRSNETESSV
ncbi:MAG: two-component sensor histidine kinase [Colwellia sp.]|nr:two-component sensor histidine kinase [Colwellia sp.]